MDTRGLSAVTEIKRFGLDRNIDGMVVDRMAYAKNIVEELLELFGHDIPKESRVKLDKVVYMMFCTAPIDAPYEKSVPVHDQIDALADNAVFSMTEMLKYGYDPEKVLLEVAKEINSREGMIINGKFEKYVDEISVAKWHRADFHNCKL